MTQGLNSGYITLNTDLNIKRRHDIVTVVRGVNTMDLY